MRRNPLDSLRVVGAEVELSIVPDDQHAREEAVDRIAVMSGRLLSENSQIAYHTEFAPAGIVFKNMMGHPRGAVEFLSVARREKVEDSPPVV